MNEFWHAFSREKNDQQYNPTLWTKRLPTEELLPAHIAFTQEKSESYRAKGVETLAFGEAEFAGSIDVFRPDTLPENAPIVVYIHGGWWQWFSKEQFSYLAQPFNHQGFAVYMPGYRMAPDWENNTPMESIVRQMQYALAAILKVAEKSAAPTLYLVGHSAGGQLVTMLQHTNWQQFNVSESAVQKLKGIFSLAGLFDIRPLVDSFVNDEIKMSSSSAAAVSPQLLAPAAHNCPVHLLLPELDTPEFFRQTKEYQQKLLAEGRNCYLKLAQSRDHLDIIEKLAEDNDEIMNYLLTNMKVE
ncbi:alpha/beta hydrolase [Thalassomonas actiniarum]|uniref:Alpha/beta hydrolase n=1 Tax=Thalassomonas actiniarum TaxID=485447 RepID=A0AAE9YZ24_9GAMM|nr:alpha/beta hydrolase [Thalassomonas actiniarum]WDE02252.1 alpha/beta hydrolase [Thalassomonas actiniarum]